MEFFNKKEDVIDLKLTQFGRHLLSKGKFKPKFYSFFDDNVLYNSERAGQNELQNNSEQRIKDTSYMRHQVSISSLEKKFANQYEQIFVTGQAKIGSESLQTTPEKNYLLPGPLGMSELTSEHAPSWSIQYLNGSLSGSSKSLTLTEKSGGEHVLQIPQLESLVTVRVEAQNDGFVDPLIDDEFEQGPYLTEYDVISEDNELFVMLKVSENNSFFQKKNFDIEVFEIEEEDQNGTIIEVLHPLYFSELPDVENELDFLEQTDNSFDPSADERFVDYYFDLLVDDEIEKEIVCELDPEVDQTLGVFADPRTRECQDLINKQKREVFNIYEDEADKPGDIC